MRGMATALLAAALLLLGASEAGAQDWREVVTQQLRASGEFARANGRSDANVLRRNEVIGVLRDGGEGFLEMELEGGVEYLFTGVCDQDCSDLDLRLYRSEGFESVDSDLAVDDVPVISYTPPSTAPYLLGIEMVDCEADICYYGVRIFRD